MCPLLLRPIRGSPLQEGGDELSMILDFEVYQKLKGSRRNQRLAEGQKDTDKGILFGVLSDLAAERLTPLPSRKDTNDNE